MKIFSYSQKIITTFCSQRKSLENYSINLHFLSRGWKDINLTQLKLIFHMNLKLFQKALNVGKIFIFFRGFGVDGKRERERATWRKTRIKNYQKYPNWSHFHLCLMKQNNLIFIFILPISFQKKEIFFGIKREGGFPISFGFPFTFSFVLLYFILFTFHYIQIKAHFKAKNTLHVVMRQLRFYLDFGIICLNRFSNVMKFYLNRISFLAWRSRRRTVADVIDRNGRWGVIDRSTTFFNKFFLK